MMIRLFTFPSNRKSLRPVTSFIKWCLEIIYCMTPFVAFIVAPRWNGSKKKSGTRLDFFKMQLAKANL